MKTLVWHLIVLTGLVSILVLDKKAIAGEQTSASTSPIRPATELEGPKLIGTKLVGWASDPDPWLYRISFQNKTSVPMSVKFLTAGSIKGHFLSGKFLLDRYAWSI